MQAERGDSTGKGWRQELVKRGCSSGGHSPPAELRTHRGSRKVGFIEGLSVKLQISSSQVSGCGPAKKIE